MSRSWTHFRRAVLALSFAGSLAFGATQALAAPSVSRITGCQLDGVQVTDCNAACRAKGYDQGTCALGRCVCRVWM